MTHTNDLRVLAIREALYEDIVGADVLIATALSALLDGVDSPSLPLLAGLSRREEGEAHDLFNAVVNELNIAPPTPAKTTPERWNLVRWLCQALVDGALKPEYAGRLIWWEGWDELGYPESLRPLIGQVSEWDDWTPSWTIDRNQIGQLIIDEAKKLLDGPWPPK
ncbi:hypothetical protein [Paenarthrobacter sp. A20]|uniref:hypothetical protein n=1 Tax=Paenarthrobacter sp. A20 TaxID=2817891 RepID=UPI00209F6AA6|nr:hypothetical protein [Paenarthrobacter sp. A20]MCP1415720.1 hypothetical protein [Paenarthrobacter sp. A20]